MKRILLFVSPEKNIRGPREREYYSWLFPFSRLLLVLIFPTGRNLGPPMNKNTDVSNKGGALANNHYFSHGGTCAKILGRTTAFRAPNASSFFSNDGFTDRRYRSSVITN